MVILIYFLCDDLLTFWLLMKKIILKKFQQDYQDFNKFKHFVLIFTLQCSHYLTKDLILSYICTILHPYKFLHLPSILTSCFTYPQFLPAPSPTLNSYQLLHLTSILTNSFKYPPSQEFRSVYRAYWWYRTNHLLLDKLRFKDGEILYIFNQFCPICWIFCQIVYGSRFNKQVVIPYTFSIPKRKADYKSVL